MKNYKIFKHADGRIEAVKQGWSWPGFLFGLIWALVKKLWAVAGVLVAFAVVLYIISIVVAPNPYDYGYEYEKQMNVAIIWGLISNILSIAVAIYIGVKGNLLRENNLMSRGYELVGTIMATNPDMAIIEAANESAKIEKAENKSDNIISHM